jgi:hypothetical protein
VAFLCTGCQLKKEDSAQKNSLVAKPEVKKQVVQPRKEEKKYDLYSVTPYDLPLYSIMEISKLQPNVKSAVDKLLEDSQGFYLLRNDGDKVLVILQNPVQQCNTYSRHELQFVEINSEGKLTYHDAGYQGVAGETMQEFEQDSDCWLFDDSTELHRPIKHIVYDEKGKVKFIENWNYDENESVKYQMKDSHKNTISILKESQDNESNLRKEHIFYDNEGKITMSLTINYDGANISRVTFYNAHDLIDSMSIISEFHDGLKVKESIYNESYELMNTVISEYIDGQRTVIKLYDREENEISKISS